MRAQMTRLCPQTRRFLMRLSRAASGARQADQRRSRYASGCGRVHGVASWAGGGCYPAVPSDQALLPSVHSKWALWDGAGRFTGTSLMRCEFSLDPHAGFIILEKVRARTPRVYAVGRIFANRRSIRVPTRRILHSARL